MSIAAAAFLFLLLLTLASVMSLLASRQVLWVLFSLLGVLLGVAGLFVMLGAEFLGVAQVVIYVGGVLVLLLFGLMYISGRKGRLRVKSKLQPTVVLVLLALLSGLGYVLLQADWGVPGPKVDQGTAQLGQALLTRYLIPFELIGLFLLVWLVSIIYWMKAQRHD